MNSQYLPRFHSNLALKLLHVTAAIFFKKSFFTFYFVRHFLQQNSVVFYIFWTKMSDSDYELPCFKLTFDFYDVGKTSSGNNNSESTNGFQSNTKSKRNNNNNKRLKKFRLALFHWRRMILKTLQKGKKLYLRREEHSTAQQCLD